MTCEQYKCDDNRFEVIKKAKVDILDKTNIDSSPEEMAVLDNILFRCWQMGWLKKYDEPQLPANLNEAAEEYIEDKHKDYTHNGALMLISHSKDISADAFKAGAEWMAEQGISYPDRIYNDAEKETEEHFTLYGYEEEKALFLGVKQGKFNVGDKVIVQIRKTE